MSTSVGHNSLGQTIVNFSRDGKFPDDDEESASYVDGPVLSAALDAVAVAKSELEAEIRTLSRESAPDVDSWIKNAKALHEDIDRSRSLANEIVRQAEYGETFDQAVKDAEDRVDFLIKEGSYNSQVADALFKIKNVTLLLQEAEQKGSDGDILAALHTLSTVWDSIYKIPAHQETRPIRLLDERAFQLRGSLHENFNSIWRALVHIDADEKSVAIAQRSEVSGMDLDTALIVMKAYKEVNDRVKSFYDDFNEVILKPRIDLKSGVFYSILIDKNLIRVSSQDSDRSIKSLFSDLEKIIEFLSQHLPPEFALSLSQLMMPSLCIGIKETWLDSAVPSSLEDMTAFRKAIALVQSFSEKVNALHWTGVDELSDWVQNAPRIWLTKRRETSLDWIRNQLALGVGTPQEVERKETQVISKIEGKHLASNTNASGGDDWDAAWSDGDESQDKTQDPWDAAQDNPENSNHDEIPTTKEEDDGADAWGWGDDDAVVEEAQHSASENPKNPEGPRVLEKTREVTITEKYATSSIPAPVLQMIISIIEDGVTLTQEENEQNPVTTAAVGLFALPTLILAMYRAVSPLYYEKSSTGNMYLYNDAMWLAEQLSNFSTQWSSRTDLGPRAQGKVKFENDIEILQRFGRRGYGREMSGQRTVLNDLLGGAQNFFQQDGGSAGENEAAIDDVVQRIRDLAAEWKPILAPAAWAQATGSLVDTLAKKFISDVEDLSTLSADQAYQVAKLISRIEKLDDLYLQKNESGEDIPTTARYVQNWFKLQFLSEVLQSNLPDVLYLWFESELSLHFTAREVVNLIDLSFESSGKTREAIAKIRANPFPKGIDADVM